MKVVRLTLTLGVSLLLVGCGGEGVVSGPTPITPPTPTFTGTVTDTVTGAPIVGFTATLSGARVTISAPGYVTRDTNASASRVDLIPEAGFDLAFYRDLARGSQQGAIQPLRVLSQPPSVYLQTAGLRPSTVAAFAAVARDLVPALTGGRLPLATWETGEVARAVRPGWITVELIADDSAPCGSSLIGAPQGHIRLNTIPGCHRNGDIVGTPNLFAHELGHALGFYHVAREGALMHPITTVPLPTEAERHHAALAYARVTGNRDIDVDPSGPVTLLPVTVH